MDDDDIEFKCDEYESNIHDDDFSKFDIIRGINYEPSTLNNSHSNGEYSKKNPNLKLKPQIIFIRSNESNSQNKTIKVIQNDKKLKEISIRQSTFSNDPVRKKVADEVKIHVTKVTPVVYQSSIKTLDSKTQVEKKVYQEVPNYKRNDLIRLVDGANMSVKTAADSLDINYNSAKKIVRIYREQGIIEKRVKGGGMSKKLTKSEVTLLRSKMNEDCTQTLSSLQDYISKEFQKDISLCTISNYMDTFRYSVKRLHPTMETALSDSSIDERKYYAAEYLKLEQNANEVYFLDCTDFSVTMRPYCVVSGSGTKRVAKSPMIKVRKVTVVVTLNKHRLHYDVYRQEISPDILEQHLTQVFDDLCHRGEKNCVFIMDYIKFRDYDTVSELFTKNGHQIRYFPLYWQRLNPVDHLFSEWHNLVRQQRPGNEEDLFSKINNVKNVIDMDQCAKFVYQAREECMNYNQSPMSINNCI